MRYYRFNFGYHTPEDWVIHQADPDFDYESTGSILVHATDEARALAWGQVLAAWYTAHLHGADSSFVWTPENYASWVDLVDPIELRQPKTVVEVGEYPNYDEMHKGLRP